MSPTTILMDVRTAALPVTDRDRAVKFDVDTTFDVDREHAARRQGGIDVDELLRWRDLPAMLTFRDVDGYTLYVFEIRSSKGLRGHS